MTNVAESVDSLLLPVDPLRGLRAIAKDLDRFAELDPKIREAKTIIDDHFGGVGSQQDRDEKLAPTLWLQLRAYVQSPEILAAIRRHLRNGDDVLRAVEKAIDTTFDLPVLQQVIQESEQLSNTDSPNSARLREARDELSSLASGTDTVPGFAAAIAIAVVVAAVIVAAVYIVDAIVN